MDYSVVLVAVEGTFEVAAEGGAKRREDFRNSCSNPLASKEDRKFTRKKVTRGHEVLLKAKDAVSKGVAGKQGVLRAHLEVKMQGGQVLEKQAACKDMPGAAAHVSAEGRDEKTRTKAVFADASPNRVQPAHRYLDKTQTRRQEHQAIGRGKRRSSTYPLRKLQSIQKSVPKGRGREEEDCRLRPEPAEVDRFVVEETAKREGGWKGVVETDSRNQNHNLAGLQGSQPNGRNGRFVELGEKRARIGLPRRRVRADAGWGLGAWLGLARWITR
jgi:hypothetical protein